MKLSESTILKIIHLIFSISLVLFLWGCDNDNETATGQASVKITDAAVDTENITGVFLSVDEVRASSNSEMHTIMTFDTPKEFNLMDYQNGDAYLLGEGELEVGTYQGIRLVLSEETESYLMMEDESTQTIEVPSGTSSGYKIQGEFEISSNFTTDLVADVDLRKALVMTGEGRYLLRPTARLVIEGGTGAIEGTVSGSLDASETLVVYAYENGTFDSSEEDEPAPGETRYQNSVNSATVAEDGSYTLAFMEEGEYELIVASYSNNDSDEDLEFNGRVSSTLMINGSSAETVEVMAGTTAIVNISL